MRYIPALIVLLVSGFLTWYVLSPGHPIKLGLDLAGGTELIYRADTSQIETDPEGALNSLREVIERRVNLFGVAEPLVQLERSSAVAGAVEERLIVELPGVTDVQAAVDAIGKTPTLEFRLLDPLSATSTELSFIPTELTGRYLEKADLQFGSQGGAGLANEPIVVLTFTAEGAALFEQITRDNIGNMLAIYLDGEPISTPVIREAIPGGTATVSGGFTPEEARELVRNLNFGALPVPIELIGSGAVGPTLGAEAFEEGLLATMIGFALVALFMIAWYRLPGLIASAALVIYVVITVALIKFIPITLTTSGIAGFILSIGMAVDANILIFERMKEELRAGKPAREALRIGFARAWTAIRDGHFTMIISSAILFWVGTSIVQGFALVFGLGVIASLVSAVFITRVLLLAIVPEEAGRTWRFLLETGFYRNNPK
ncbi:MAG TPA: protein translocase subunit SecD [Candidatus Paceibacterota bacterium]|nr:protein translocase subunit SecD [Candidatus Paceibacterota bacterium]